MSGGARFARQAHQKVRVVQVSDARPGAAEKHLEAHDVVQHKADNVTENDRTPLATADRAQLAACKDPHDRQDVNEHKGPQNRGHPLLCAPLDQPRRARVPRGHRRRHFHGREGHAGSLSRRLGKSSTQDRTQDRTVKRALLPSRVVFPR